MLWSIHDLCKLPCLLITDTVILILLSFFRFKGLSKVKEIIKCNKQYFTFFLNLICLLWIFDGVWILQLVSSETIATKSSKATFKHCPKLKDAYTGPSEMLELTSSACIHNNVKHHIVHTELFEKSNKIKKGKTHSKPATKGLENLCN